MITLLPGRICSDHIGKIKPRDFFQREYTITDSGREALSIIIREMDVSPSDEIFVTTTFGTFYVSSCVSSEIFNFCKPSKVLSEKTRGIFVIHENGMPHKGIMKYRKIASDRGIPLIEDCAHSIGSFYRGLRLGFFSDYTIYSLPKIFPLEEGGLLVGTIGCGTIAGENLTTETKKELPYLLYNIPQYASLRRRNYSYLAKKLSKHGLKPHYSIGKNVSPFYFPLNIQDPTYAKTVFAEHSIETAVWWGREVLWLPVHQYLTREELDIICNVAESLAR
jgi:hypothetical protein